MQSSATTGLLLSGYITHFMLYIIYFCSNGLLSDDNYRMFQIMQICHLFVFQALSSILIMFVIEWVYALANIVVALLLFFYIGKTSPGLPTGDFNQFISC